MCPLEAMGYFYAQGVTRDMKQDNSFVKRKEFFFERGHNKWIQWSGCNICGSNLSWLTDMWNMQRKFNGKDKSFQVEKILGQMYQKKNLNFFQKLF